MHRYIGHGVMPEIPGVPMRDLTDDEFIRFCDLHGAGALSGVYIAEASDDNNDPHEDMLEDD